MDIFITEFLKKALGGFIRTGLAFLAGAIGIGGLFTDDQLLQAGLAVAGVAIAIGWSFYQKWQSERETVKALNAPPGTTLEEVKKAV